jgi:4-amino-4-deoxy-L-arabinose transferase-like glycosyltransferase
MAGWPAHPFRARRSPPVVIFGQRIKALSGQLSPAAPGAVAEPAPAPRAGEELDRGLGRGLAQLAARPMLRTAALLILCLLLFLPGFFAIPPIDRDEARYAQASKQMLESGDLVDIRFQDEPRHKKPVGIYWLQVASVGALGPEFRETIWAYRLPSLGGALIVVLLLPWAGAGLVGREAALLGAVMIAACVLLGVEARLAKTDAVLLATVVVAQGALARLYLTEDEGFWPWPALFWAALGAGMLIKGPIAPMVSGGTILALLLIERRAVWLRRLRPVPGIPLAALIVLPWLIAILWFSESGLDGEDIRRDFLDKIWSGQESHGAPPGTYLLAFWATFWPFSLLTGLALPWIWRHRREPGVRFCLAWIVPTWLAFELAVTKLPHYVLPTYPAIALLTAAALLDRFGLPAGHRPKRWWLVPMALFALVALALAITPAALVFALESWIDLVAVVGGLLAVVLAAFALRSVFALRPHRALALLLGAGLVTYATAFGRVLPELDRLWIAPRVAQAVAEHRPCPQSRLASTGFREPSLVLLTGTDTHLTDGAGAAAFLLADRCHLALVGHRQAGDFERVLAESGGGAVALARIEGFNFNGGNRLDLTLYAQGGGGSAPLLPSVERRPGQG